jgi:hypothetical protein
MQDKPITQNMVLLTNAHVGFDQYLGKLIKGKDDENDQYGLFAYGHIG